MLYFLGLVLAPGFRDSTSSLSYPHTTELVNSLIKACVYSNIARVILRSPYHLTENKEEIDCDLRKNLYVSTGLSRTVTLNPDTPFRCWFFGCQSYGKAVLGTRMTWLRGSEFRKFDIAEFKQVKQHLLSCFNKALTNILEGYRTA